jgi:glycosyltransferase involved in cell wall biosynthesis
MQRFTDLLAHGLRGRGLDVAIFHPPVFLGRLRAGHQGIGKWLGYVDKYLLAPLFLRRAVRRLPQPRLVHICDHSNAFYTRALAAELQLVTCHDLLAVRSALGEIPQNPLRATGKQQQAIILRGLRRCRYIVSVSAATRDDVRRLVGDSPERIRVIPNALDEAFIEAAHTPRAELQSKLPNPLAPRAGSEIYVHIGGEKWYKNRGAMLRLFAEIARREPHAQLAIVGSRFSEAQLKEGHCAGLAERIHYLHNLSDEALRGLYAWAKLLIFPSWIEGFGWPILEAQACSCPVATLDRAPMNELNAVVELCLPIDCEAAGWAADAADRIENYFQAAKHKGSTESGSAALPGTSELQAFAARFTNQSAIEAYLELYRCILEGSRTR